MLPNPFWAGGQALIRVVATSVNPVEHKLASGQLKQFFPLQFPWTPGADFSGVVEAVGPGASPFKKGDEVFGWNPGMGAYAEMLTAPQAMLLRKPKNVSHFEAASLATVAQSAWQALFEITKITSGQRVLIHSGAGGVGTMAIQLAHRAGARVYTTASSQNRQNLLSLGADEVIDYNTTPFETVAQGMDVVIDTLGGPVQQRSLPLVKPGGILISTVQPPPQDVAQKLGITAVMMRTEADPGRLQKIMDLVASGELKPVISKTYALADVKEAWTQILSGHTKGKIVLKV